MLDWRTIQHANRDQRYVRGTELDYCFPDGFLHRFKIVSVRTVNREDNPSYADGRTMLTYDVKYRVYDAATVTDAEIKQGIAPRSIAEFATLDEALAFIEPSRHIEYAE